MHYYIMRVYYSRLVQIYSSKYDFLTLRKSVE